MPLQLFAVLDAVPNTDTVCFFFIYFHIWTKLYLEYITKMLSSFFRYYKMLVLLGLHKYIYNVLHKNARYNSEVFNLYYKNIFSIGLQNETFFHMYMIQNFRILHYSLIIRTYFHKNILIIIYFTMFYTRHYIIHECIIYITETLLPRILHKITILYVINYSDPMN